MSCLEIHQQQAGEPSTAICIECREELTDCPPNPQTAQLSPARKSDSPPRRPVPPSMKEAPLSNSEKKGRNRKNSRKKRKQRAIERMSIIGSDNLDTAVDTLRQVLEDIYWKIDSYDPASANVAELVNSIADEKKFYEHLNEIIKDLIEVLASYTQDFKDEIWEKVEERIEEEHASEPKLKDCRRIIEWPEFYSFFIDLMHERVESIKASSKEVEKIIDQYNRHYESKNPQTVKKGDRDYQMDLFRNTFMYMVNSDRLLKRFMKCAQKLFTKELNGQRTNQATLIKLKEMTAVLRPLESDDDEQDEDYEEAELEGCTRNLDSTSNASTDVCQEEQQPKPKKKKKKKKPQSSKEPQNSLKDSLHGMDCGCQSEQEHIHTYTLWFDQATAKQKLQCDFDRGWLTSFQLQLRN